MAKEKHSIPSSACEEATADDIKKAYRGSPASIIPI
jgi:hypothetical protein